MVKHGNDNEKWPKVIFLSKQLFWMFSLSGYYLNA